MMPIQFPIRSYHNNPLPVAAPMPMKLRHQDFPKESCRVGRRRRVKTDSSGQFRLVKKHNNPVPPRQIHPVRLSNVHGIICCLPGCQDGKLDSTLRQNIQRFQVCSGFRQPQPLGNMSKSVFKIGDSPAHLGHFFHAGSKRQDGMMICLCHAIPHTVSFKIPLFLGNNQFTGVRIIHCHPFK